ncbi:dihydrofolate reductase family protein [Kribbella sp. NPDC051770]|uniref:dihydrofolate reductase family protein n=1 Tax=Kribbella sp. NPDC051770 TaxID=3155413 RepID=UPI00343F35A2
MRKIVAGLFISLDGVTEAPDQWHFPYFDDAMGARVDALTARSDTMLVGRKTYQEFAAFWPTAEMEMAEHMNGAPKLVVSRTLDTVDAWQNSTLVEGDDPIETLRKLKEGPGKDISVVGSSTLVRSLLRAKVLDELHLLVHPIAVCHGARLFDDGETVPLELISVTPFGTGVLHTVYRPAE